MELLNEMSEYLNDFLLNAGVWAPIFSTILVFCESFLAFLPLVVFVTINVLSLGYFWGILLSWVFTVLGSCCMFLLSKKLNKWFLKKSKKRKSLAKFKKIVSKLSFSSLAIICSCPFTPVFFINVAAGLVGIPIKKYLIALMIGDVISVSLLAFMGNSFVKSLENPIIFLNVVIVFVFTYFFTKFIGRKFNIE